MKYLLWLLVLLACITAQAQHNSHAKETKKADLILARLHAQQAVAADSSELQQMAAAAQNNGQRMEEQGHDYKKALLFIDTAIVLYAALGDTLNLAFNKKYKGHLLVRLGKSPQAKVELREAIRLYNLKNAGAGVASAQFDLARLFEFNNRNDSAIYYAALSRAFWQLQENSLQVLVINNMMVYHFLQLNQTENATAVYHESEALLKKHPQHWQPELDFYFTSMLLFRQVNDAGNASHYRELYLDKVALLHKEGITAKSYYEQFSL